MRYRTEPRKNKTLLREVTTSRGASFLYRPIEPATDAVIMVGVNSHLRSSLPEEVLSAAKGADADVALRVLMSEHPEYAYRMGQIGRLLSCVRMGLCFASDDVEFETPRPVPSRMTPAQWVEYAQAIDEELQSEVALDCLTDSDVAEIVAAATRSVVDEVETEKNA